MVSPTAGSHAPSALQPPETETTALPLDRRRKDPRVCFWWPETERFEDAALLTLKMEAGAPGSRTRPGDRVPEPRATCPLTPRLQDFRLQAPESTRSRCSKPPFASAAVENEEAGRTPGQPGRGGTGAMHSLTDRRTSHRRQGALPGTLRQSGGANPGGHESPSQHH